VDWRGEIRILGQESGDVVEGGEGGKSDLVRRIHAFIPLFKFGGAED